MKLPPRHAEGLRCGPRTNADFVRDLRKRTTARDVSVRPVLVFPGRYVTHRARGARTWVRNPKGVLPFLRNQPQTLSREDVALYTDRLTRELTGFTKPR